jgi:hypothetical protein
VSLRIAAAAMVVAVLAVLAWRSELFTVEKPGAVPRPLAIAPEASRPHAQFDASLPMVPVGVEHLSPGGEVLLVHYWAPWERHGGAQAITLDSLRRSLEPGALRLAVVCFDPYPSVSRYVGRMRLRLPVLLDLDRALARHLPCPSIPYTYVIDRAGRIAVAQPGEVDWLARETRAALDTLLAEPRPLPRAVAS